MLQINIVFKRYINSFIKNYINNIIVHNYDEKLKSNLEDLKDIIRLKLYKHHY